MPHIIRESFPNINTMLSTIDSREENFVMRGERHSTKGTRSFTGTSSYNEAVHLLRYGYKDILPQVQKALKEQKEIANKLFFIPKAIHYPNMVGFAPHVPNAIAGLPNSMINISKTIRKQRTISIKYFMEAPWTKETGYFIKAGTALVSAINIIELHGIQTKLSVVVCSGKDLADCEREVVIADVVIKNFGERFDLQKICFPLIHPSFFRRIGFKYLETCPELTSNDFLGSYGRVLEQIDIEKYDKSSKDTKVLNIKWIQDNDNDIEKIIKKVGLTDGTISRDSSTDG